MGRVENFEHLAFGMFVHFGLYSVVGKGEWYLASDPDPDKDMYSRLPEKFNVSKNWAKELVKTAKKAGCRYITLTTRHHDGFSLYDTAGLNEWDAPHSACGRDLVKEFVDACRQNGIVPMFYHTLLDWHEESYKNDFPAYIDYLVKSLELLCTRYGKIGGFWFDGMWDGKDKDWQEDRIYGTIRRYQPDAMIINNTGLSALGEVGHEEIDAVTFERGRPFRVRNGAKKIAGEMCQVMNDHWGYAENDINYKPVSELIDDLVECRSCGCNFLLNVGPKGGGMIRTMDREILSFIGRWIKKNGDFIYNAFPSDVTSKDAYILTDGKYHYAVTKSTMMSADANVALSGNAKSIVLDNAEIVSGVWLDSGEEIVPKSENSFAEKPFPYGENLASHRAAKLILKK